MATVVVEASETSGARHQAEAAIAHGKPGLLLDILVTDQPWAEEMAHGPGNVTVVSGAGQITRALDDHLAIIADDLFALAWTERRLAPISGAASRNSCPWRRPAGASDSRRLRPPPNSPALTSNNTTTRPTAASGGGASRVRSDRVLAFGRAPRRGTSPEPAT
jgi:predicted Rossmann fold nucleotide-binding protein DprA/Smf involved in DNA uptake